MNKLPARKTIRLKGYDYSSPEYYFITICCKDRKCLFGEITVGEGFHALPRVKLTEIGDEVEKSILFIHQNISNIKIDKYIIMPNHIHMIVIIESEGHGSPPLQEIIKRLKTFTNKRYNEIMQKTDLILWQRSYHDHIIRGEDDYQNIWDYIDINPLRWRKDRFYIE